MRSQLMSSSNTEKKQTDVYNVNAPSVKNTDTNVPPLQWDETGITLPEESDILTGVIEDFQNAFGYQLKFYNNQGNFLLSTPQGQLATSIAAIISDRNRLLAYYVNQVDPSYATGRMQDGIGRIYFIERIKAEPTSVVGICRGLAGVQIPEGTKVQDQNGHLYEADRTYTIGDSGTVEVLFKCTEKGPIACAAHSLQMYQLISGWDNVDNPIEGIVGRHAESQAQFEERRRQSIAKNSVNSVDSIMAALLNLTENINGKEASVCQDVYVVDNPNGDYTTGNVKIKPHSIYVCVAASDTAEHRNAIAQTIWQKKPPGCDMTGEVAVTVADNSGLYSTPPIYNIYYTYAKEVPLKFYVKLAQPQFQPNDAAEQIKNAIMDAFNGTDGSSRPRIGSQVLASSFYGPVQKLGTWVRIVHLYIGRDLNSDPDAAVIQMDINEIPTLNKNNIRVSLNNGD